MLGPLFRVEMVTVARRRRYFILRVVYGALALFLLWSAYTSMYAFSYRPSGSISIQQGARLATSFFVMFSWLQILAILAVGPALAVGTIATERERRTIEYLFTTDLSNSEIILGKLVARLCLVGQLLLVGLPILFLFRLLGGIPAQLLVVTYMYAVSAALLIATMSICVSVWSERARDATVRVYLLLGVFTFLPIILQTAGGVWPFNSAIWNSFVRPVIEFCVSINPMWNLGMAIGSQNAIGARLDMALIWETLGYQLLVSAAAICLAIVAVRRVHLKETTKAASEERRRFKMRMPRWKRPLANNPMIWKEMFAGTAVTKLGSVGRICMAIILATVCFFSGAAFFQHTQFNQYNTYHSYLIGLSGFLVTGILLLLAARSAGLVTSEKERDCWLSLLSTPLTGSEIVRSKMWGNLYSVRWPLIVLLINWGLGVLLAPEFFLALVFLLGTFVILAWYVTNLGLCFSLQSPTTLRAIGATIGTLVFTGGGYLFCCCPIIAFGPGSGDEMIVILSACIPFLSIFPLMAFQEFVQGYGGLEEGMTVAYVLGMIGYLIAGICLHTYMENNFDRLAGRTETVPG